MASPLLLGNCPACNAPRKYTAYIGQRVWLRCPGPVCTSHPEETKPTGNVASNIISLSAARLARASQSVH